jgi:hypothetical protein
MGKMSELKTDGLFFIPVKGKAPSFGGGWQREEMDFSEAVAHGGTGVGLSHGVSNTCCLDIDDVPAAEAWFKKYYDVGSIMEYLDGHFEVLSPNAKSGKFMFKLPEGVSLSKFALPDIKLEFRSQGHQDVWPGSKYPPKGGDWREWNAENGYYWHKGSNALKDLPLPLVKIWQAHDQERGSVGRSDAGHLDSAHSRDQLYNNIMTGKDYHDSLRSLSLGLIKDGMGGKEAFIILSNLVMGSNPPKDREDSKQRVMADGFNELQDLINGADSFKEADVDVDIEKIADEMDKSHKLNKMDIPWPPGRMGELADAAYNYQRYQYRELAIVSAIGLIAGICGRKFDVSHPPTGLNVYLTVLGPTGIGKGSIEKFINQVMFNNSGLGRSISFMGDNDFTSGTVLMKKLENAKCMISITDEAGQSMSSKSGDPQKKILTLLDLYSKSGSGDYAMNQGQRDKEFSTNKLKGTAFSWINISTPEVFKREFYQQGSISNGLAPRMSIYSIEDIVIKANKKPELVLGTDIKSRLDYLITECSKVQSTEECDAWQFNLSPELEAEADELEEHYRTVMRDLRVDDVNKSDMHNRAYLKVLKFAALATTINKTKDDPDSLTISKTEWDWGKAMVEYEMNSVDMFFTGKYFGDSLGDGIAVVRKNIFKMLSKNGDIKDRAANLTSDMKKHQTFTKTAIYRRLKNNTVLRELSDDPKFKSRPISGLDKVLTALLDCGDLREIVSAASKAKKVYKVCEGLLLGLEV